MNFLIYAGVIIIVCMLIESHKKQNKIMKHLGIKRGEED